MSGDMISRRSILDKINEWSIKLNCENSKQFTLAEFEHMVANETTAYDADKVIKSINEIGQRYCNSVKCDKKCENCEHGCLMRAITNAVKSGGVVND